MSSSFDRSMTSEGASKAVAWEDDFRRFIARVDPSVSCMCRVGQGFAPEDTTRAKCCCFHCLSCCKHAVTALLVLLQDAAQSKVYCLIRTAEQIQRAVVKQQGRKPRRKFISSNKIWLRQVLRCKMTCTWPIPNLTRLY